MSRRNVLIMLILGVTGGIATGKSTVCRLFAEHGARVVDADRIARSILEPGTPESRQVAQAFPDCVAEGTPDVINRRALGERIFNNSAARRVLERITHPAIVSRLKEEIAALRTTDDKLAVAEIPLLFEVGLQGLVDAILVVACPEGLQISRIRERLHTDETGARSAIASQLPLGEKIAQADFVVSTGLSIADTERQIETVLSRLPH